MTVTALAEILHGTVEGNGESVVLGFCSIVEANAQQVTFLGNPKYEPALAITKAAAVIASLDVKNPRPDLTLIRVKDPSHAFAQAVSILNPVKEVHHTGVSQKSSVAASASIGAHVAIGAFAVIDDDAVIGENTVIYPGVYVGRNVTVGRDCILYPNVVIYHHCTLGDRVILHAGVAIGCDGFGYATVNGVHEKVAQVGVAVIEDDVEIGGNSVVDRARFDKTVVGKGTKIDNLVQVAHNVTIGKGCLMVAQSGVAGSSKLGDYVVIAGQVGVSGHLEIGDGVIVGAQSGVSKSLPSGDKYWGTPAQSMKREMVEKISISKLPEALKRLKELEKALADIRVKVA
jgi:UDP-3-O-[3-hydroxymyristoyl] glucosamine N-acyltransferase